MAISLTYSAASGKAQLELKRTTRKLNTSFERLSTGLRLNSAKDGPADLAVADRLRAQTRLATVAIRNVNDGISLTSIADDAASEISNILVRMAELAEQSANGVLTTNDRSALQFEFDQLGSEVQRLARVTEFNSIALLSASGDVSFQVGLDSDASSRISYNGVEATLNSLGLSTGGGDVLGYSIIDTSIAGSQDAASNALDAVKGAINTLASTRGNIGGTQSRLEFALSYLDVARANYEAADSQIRDADVAEELASVVRLEILQDSQTAVIAQANQDVNIVRVLLDIAV